MNWRIWNHEKKASSRLCWWISLFCTWISSWILVEFIPFISKIPTYPHGLLEKFLKKNIFPNTGDTLQTRWKHPPWLRWFPNLHDAQARPRSRPPKQPRLTCLLLAAAAGTAASCRRWSWGNVTKINGFSGKSIWKSSDSGSKYVKIGYPNNQPAGYWENRRKSLLSGVLFFTAIIYKWVRNHGNGMMREIIPGANFRPMKHWQLGMVFTPWNPLGVHPIELKIPCNL